mmetsp:Transcript_49672/g.50518  ORF Transcript_49672/g.50518 Transcript_49672/m.50518 type:complete len:108 (+) Transcript_49672:44-367(+)
MQYEINKLTLWVGLSSDRDLTLILLWYHFLVSLSAPLGDAFSRNAFPKCCHGRKHLFLFDGNIVIPDPSDLTPVCALRGKLLMTERSDHIFTMVSAPGNNYARDIWT